MAERIARKPKSWRVWVNTYADGIDGMVFRTRANAERWLYTTAIAGGKVERATLTLDASPQPRPKRKSGKAK